MIAIVDSGSTKADWKIVSENTYPTSIHTMGFNPFYHSSERISREIKSAFKDKIDSARITRVLYYGAGCSSEERKQIVHQGLSAHFVNAEIEVYHDILAAAQATAGTAAGICCILGTGSNSCLYDGEKIIDNVANLAYILGDEGSGGHLGKLLIQGYFYREFPQDIKEDFEEEYGTDRQVFLNNIYHQPHANVYLASFARFLSDHKDHIYIQNLVTRAFSEFLKRHVQKYEGHNSLPIHFIGSVAYHFGDLLKMTLDERNLKIGSILKKPIDNLVKYHLNKISNKD